ncbi:MAG: NAD(P)H-hydrate dehydratase, partial [Candidatus Diapherotrites archaeon]|nr:NAD(P)H-hydrate dehydratase [Candidatus Diapherotrites archaeon]
MKTVRAADVSLRLPVRRPDSFKGQNGRVLIGGGSSEYVGAPVLAALAAQRCGVDLVRIMAPEQAGFVMNSFSPDLIVQKLKGNFLSSGHLKAIREQAARADVVLIGPGLGLEKSTQSLVRKLVAEWVESGSRLVLDADALKACAGMSLSPNVLITPHAGEFLAFSGKKVPLNVSLLEKAALVKQVAHDFGCTVLLKGPLDVVSDGKTVLLNKTGNPAMTAGGTGDVLAGLSAGLFVQMKDPLWAAAGAAYVNGLAGDLCFKEKGFSLTASDLIGFLPGIF